MSTDGTARARKWASENPLTAKRAGVLRALDCAALWKKALDRQLARRDAEGERMQRMADALAEWAAAKRDMPTHTPLDQCKPQMNRLIDAEKELFDIASDLPTPSESKPR